MRLVRLMCGVSLKDRQPSNELRRRIGVESIGGRDEKIQTKVACTHGQN